MIRFLHTADWHLGRWLHGTSLLDDQAFVLDQLVALARDERVDALVVAGDVYDRSVPAADAVELLDDVLTRLVIEAGIAVIVIAGNHDSGERIGFGGRIAAATGLHLRGTLADLSPIVLPGAGEVAFHALPYAEPAFVRALPGGDAVTDHQSAMAHALSLLRARFVAGRRNVLVGHAFVAGGSESESERPLAVGGSGLVGAETFAGFDYVALGHLHRPQCAGSPRIRYSGSLLKYSFAEAEQRKSVTLVELRPGAEPAVREIALAPRRDLRVISGTFAELRDRPAAAGSRDDYLCAVLTDRHPVLDPMARLREVYPNLLELRFERARDAGTAAGAAGDHRQRSPDDLFRAFWRDIQGEEIADSAIAAFQACAARAATDPR